MKSEYRTVLVVMGSLIASGALLVWLIKIGLTPHAIGELSLAHAAVVLVVAALTWIAPAAWWMIAGAILILPLLLFAGSAPWLLMTLAVASYSGALIGYTVATTTRR